MEFNSSAKGFITQVSSKERTKVKEDNACSQGNCVKKRLRACSKFYLAGSQKKQENGEGQRRGGGKSHLSGLPGRNKMKGKRVISTVFLTGA
jgi:hypothetical protein